MQEKMLTYSATTVVPFLQNFDSSHVSKVYVIQVEKIMDVERKRFLFFFFF